jgi:hypothetical protein
MYDCYGLLRKLSQNSSDKNFKETLDSRMGLVTCSLEDSQSLYVSHCIDCLKNLESHLQTERPDSIGLKDQRSISILISIIVCWGICPCLDEEIKNFILGTYKYPPNKSARNYALYAESISLFVNLSCDPVRSQIGEIIFKRHLNELIIPLINSQRIINSGLLSTIKLTTICDINMKISDLIFGIMRCVCSNPSLPEWAKNLASESLSKLIMRKSGVLSLIQVLLDGGSFILIP